MNTLILCHYKFLRRRKTSIWWQSSLVHWSAETLRYIKGLVCLFHMDLVTFPAHTGCILTNNVLTLQRCCFSQTEESPFMGGKVQPAFLKPHQASYVHMTVGLVIPFARWARRAAETHDRTRERIRDKCRVCWRRYIKFHEQESREEIHWDDVRGLREQREN